jgi:hypothetical protein
MVEDLRTRADARLTEALACGGFADPRQAFRDRLRALRESDQAAFARAKAYYEDTLTPRVAAAESDPIAEWIEYGRLLGEAAAAGSVVEVDATGRSRTYVPPPSGERLVLHLPTEPTAPVLILSAPATPSPAQQATIQLLVEQKRS